MTSRLSRIAKGALVPCALALLLFASLEAGCRILGRVRTGAWPETRAESYRRFVLKIGSAYRRHPFLVVAGRANAVLSVPGHEVHLNALGQRGPDPAMPKPPGTFRIVCEGGSTTFDLLAPDDAHTWPFLLRGKLAARGGDVVNSGFPGWTTVESLVSFELRDVDLSPDLVVVFAGVNDLQPAGHVPFTKDYTLGHADLLPRVLGVASVPLSVASRSLFMESLLDAVHRSAASPEGWAPAWRWKGGARKDDIPDEAAAVFARNLLSTVGAARAHGARTLLVAQAARLRKGKEKADGEYLESWAPGLTPTGFQRALARYAVAARSVADRSGASFLDPFASGAFGDEDYADPFHFSTAGSERFAALLAAWVGERLPNLRPDSERTGSPLSR
jgi:lysophospholipase L1-like esterase